ncbi:Panacea domain-containing protein [Polyangium fumosum]|uniref:DUF4065 domain-containing protein n=1 Tax=Polyangium fumosum TaxID=889272 RepID=A0A4U1IV23_9BACT|nr:Panacea domain-containing protein [Polyangium fumosum]TKC98313.1 DUF4065 domain-containing protein [Polyangium fumosum]
MDQDKQAQERLIEAAVALLEGAPGRRMQITNLNKALFYLDLVALRDTGKTITDNVYLAMDNGPVMHGYREKLVGALEKLALAHQDDEGLGKPVVLTGQLESYHFLDDHWRKKAEQVASIVAGVSAAKISQSSHSNLGWKIADARRTKGGKKTAPPPINMFIAMQSICGKDPWLTEPADDAFNAALEADGSDGEPW